MFKEWPCLLLYPQGDLLTLKSTSPQTTTDHRWPQSIQEDAGQEGGGTGQHQAFCSTAVVMATVHAGCLYSCPVFSFPIHPARQLWSKEGVLLGTKGGPPLHPLPPLPPGLEVLCLIGANSSCCKPTGIASRVPIGDMLNYKPPYSSRKYGLSPGMRSFSPSRCNLPVRDHFKHEHFCLRNIVDIILFFDVHGSRA